MSVQLPTNISKILGHIDLYPQMYLPDEPFHNFGALKSIAQHQSRQSMDLEALGKALVGCIIQLYQYEQVRSLPQKYF